MILKSQIEPMAGDNRLLWPPPPKKKKKKKKERKKKHIMCAREQMLSK